MSIAWGITGAGHFLRECADLLRSLKEVDGFVTEAGYQVLRSYGLLRTIQEAARRFYRDDRNGNRAVGRLYTSIYRLVVIAPATSNSVAKMACGISDTVVTNLFAHAGKCRIPLVVLPTDTTGEVVSEAPGRRRVVAFPRPIDLENAERLSSWPGVTVVRSTEELGDRLRAWVRDSGRAG